METAGRGVSDVLLSAGLLCAAAVIALLVAEARGWVLGRWVAKPVASSTFVGAGLAAGGLASVYGRLVLLGLCFCWAGDLLLIPRGRRSCFLAGVAAFLAGHVAFASAFATRPWHAGAFVAGTVVMVAFGWTVWRWLRPHLPAGLAGAVGAYVVTICAMAACALAATAGGGPVTIAGGALAFVASDLSVARDRFVAPAFTNLAWGLPLYYAATLALASTV